MKAPQMFLISLFLPFVLLLNACSVGSQTNQSGSGPSSTQQTPPRPQPAPATDDCRATNDCSNAIENLSDAKLASILENIRADFYDKSQSEDVTAKTPEERRNFGIALMVDRVNDAAVIEPNGIQAAMKALVKLYPLFFDQNGYPVLSINPLSIHNQI